VEIWARVLTHTYTHAHSNTVTRARTRPVESPAKDCLAPSMTVEVDFEHTAPAKGLTCKFFVLPLARSSSLWTDVVNFEAYLRNENRQISVLAYRACPASPGPGTRGSRNRVGGAQKGEASTVTSGRPCGRVTDAPLSAAGGTHTHTHTNSGTRPNPRAQMCIRASPAVTEAGRAPMLVQGRTKRPSTHVPDALQVEWTVGVVLTLVDGSGRGGDIANVAKPSASWWRMVGGAACRPA
jgi:hypothetical protein